MHKAGHSCCTDREREMGWLSTHSYFSCYTAYLHQLRTLQSWNKHTYRNLPTFWPLQPLSQKKKKKKQTTKKQNKYPSIFFVSLSLFSRNTMYGRDSTQYPNWTQQCSTALKMFQKQMIHVLHHQHVSAGKFSNCPRRTFLKTARQYSSCSLVCSKNQLGFRQKSDVEGNENMQADLGGSPCQITCRHECSFDR